MRPRSKSRPRNLSRRTWRSVRLSQRKIRRNVSLLQKARSSHHRVSQKVKSATKGSRYRGRKSILRLSAERGLRGRTQLSVPGRGPSRRGQQRYCLRLFKLVKDDVRPSAGRPSSLKNNQGNRGNFIQQMLTICTLGIASAVKNVLGPRNQRSFLKINVQDCEATFLFDSGSMVTLMSEKEFRRIPVEKRPKQLDYKANLIGVAPNSP